MGMRKITFNNREIVGKDVPFLIEKDASIVLKLDDGATVHVCPVVINVIKTDEKTPDGDRLYIVQHLVHVSLLQPPTEDLETGK